MPLTLKAFCGELAKQQRVLIASHISPDPDAVCSAAALALGLCTLGVQAEVFLADPPPTRVCELLGDLHIAHEIPNGQFSGFIGVDSATAKRLGKAQYEDLLSLANVTFNIDHHVSSERWATWNWIQPAAASSTELVYAILKELSVEITPVLANLLLAGLMDDTGSFRFSNCTKEALQVAAELVGHGASPLAVGHALYFSVPVSVLRLRALALARIRLVLDGKAALLRVPQTMLSEAGATDADTESLVDEVRTIKGTLVVAMVRELRDEQVPNKWKVSLRAKVAEIDVNEIAALFGGGGHKAAAGYRIVGQIEDIEDKLCQELAKALAKASCGK